MESFPKAYFLVICSAYLYKIQVIFFIPFIRRLIDINTVSCFFLENKPNVFFFFLKSIVLPLVNHLAAFLYHFSAPQGHSFNLCLSFSWQISANLQYPCSLPTLEGKICVPVGIFHRLDTVSIEKRREPNRYQSQCSQIPVLCQAFRIIVRNLSKWFRVRDVETKQLFFSEMLPEKYTGAESSWTCIGLILSAK